MAYDEALADKVRRALAGTPTLTEKKMFGGVAFLVNAAMCVGVHGADLIVRCEKDETDKLLAKQGVRIFDLSGGRAMKGWLLVGPTATKTAAGFKSWMEFARAWSTKSENAPKSTEKRAATPSRKGSPAKRGSAK